MSLMTYLREGEQWNEQLLNELFTLVESAAIKRIPIREGTCPDRWVWQYTNKGTFTIKSAYHAQIFAKQSRSSSSSSTSMGGSAKTWKGLWNTAFMPKIRKFLWKALHNKLPEEEILVKRRYKKKMSPLRGTK